MKSKKMFSAPFLRPDVGGRQGTASLLLDHQLALSPVEGGVGVAEPLAVLHQDALLGADSGRPGCCLPVLQVRRSAPASAPLFSARSDEKP